MKPVIHKERLYTGDLDREAPRSDAERRLIKIAELVCEYRPASSPTETASGRNLFTRFIDRTFALARKYAPPIHRAGAAVVAFLLFVYARLLALTVRLLTVGFPCWPNLPAPCVMTVWHGCAPSLLIAIAACRPRPPIAIMISRDPRGDSLALLCRLLGLRVVRGDSQERGWTALVELVREIENGACALITADGGGPARAARVGAVALSMATGVPLVAIGADCHPALFMRRKWDRARTPLPFGRIVITRAQPRHIPLAFDAEVIEQARCMLQVELDRVTEAAKTE
jgi:lysophospholipid acyltransferase (LPLAT)-like uncharacterized protein